MRLKNPVVLDTDVASLIWRGRLEPEDRQKLVNRTAMLTFVTVAEFWRGAYKDNWGPAQITKLTEYYGEYELIPCDFAVVKEWGRLSGLAGAAGTPVPPNDCWIAACCVTHDYPLLTHDKHFRTLEQYGLRLL